MISIDPRADVHSNLGIQRALALWHADPSLGIALDVAKDVCAMRRVHDDDLAIAQYVLRHGIVSCIDWHRPCDECRSTQGIRSPPRMAGPVHSCMNAGVPAPERAIPFVPAPRPHSSLSKPPPDPIVTAGAYSYGKTLT